MVLAVAIDAVLDRAGYQQKAPVAVSAPQTVAHSGIVQTLAVVRGAGQPAKIGSRVVAHVRIECGGSLLLDTVSNGLPFEFVVGGTQIPEFLSSGVVGLQAHGKRTFVVPAEHAGGTQGLAPLLPPGKDIQVTVAVLSITSA